MSSEKALRLRGQEKLMGPDVAQELLTQIYMTVLGHEPDDSVIQSVRLRVQSERMSISQLYVMIMAEPDLAAMPRAKAERIVTDAYDLVLDRPPEDAAFDLQVNALVEGVQDPHGLFRQLLLSDERTWRDSWVGPAAAQDLLERIYATILGHPPTESVIEQVRRHAQSQHVTIAQLHSLIMSGEEFKRSVEQIVSEAYELVVNRQPEEGALDLQTDAVIDGIQSAHGLFRALLMSNEYVARDVGRTIGVAPDLAQACLTPIYRALLGREPEPEAVEALKLRAEAEHITIPQLCVEIIEGPEFAARARQLPAVADYIAQQSRPGGASEDIVLFIQDLISMRLEDRGCRWALPPLFPSGQVVPADQVIGLIRTLTMLGGADPREIRQ